MEKVIDYFQERKLYPSVSFPQLTPAENDEVLRQIGLPDEQRKLNTNAEEVINGTLRKMNHTSPSSLGFNLNLGLINEMNNAKGKEENEEIMTVRIRKGTEEAIGTVTIKGDDEYGTIKFLGTIKRNDGGTPEIERDYLPEWMSNCGTLRISREEFMTGKISSIPTSPNVDFSFLYSKNPEQWEINILSLENGEWNEGMNKVAFGKYKKERPALKGVFSETSNSKKAQKNRKSSNRRSSKFVTPSPEIPKKKRVFHRKSMGVSPESQIKLHSRITKKESNKTVMK